MLCLGVSCAAPQSNVVTIASATTTMMWRVAIRHHLLDPATPPPLWWSQSVFPSMIILPICSASHWKPSSWHNLWFFDILTPLPMARYFILIRFPLSPWLMATTSILQLGCAQRNGPSVASGVGARSWGGWHHHQEGLEHACVSSISTI